MDEKYGRMKIDHAIRKLWSVYRDMSDEHADKLTEDDLNLWGILTIHPAVQVRLDTPTPNKDGDDSVVFS